VIKSDRRIGQGHQVLAVLMFIFVFDRRSGLH